MSAKIRLTIYLLVAVFGLLPGVAVAQSTFATITGSVTDSSGAVIPDVTIQALHDTLGLTYTTKSNEAGIYTLPELREGSYAVTASKTGFNSFRADRVTLQSRGIRRLDIVLSVGTVTQSVEVTAAPGLIQTENATISSMKSERELNALPVTSSGFSYFFMTFPMTVARGSSPSFAGSRNDQFNVMIDGNSASSGAGGMLSNLYGNNEDFKEMRVETVSNNAELASLGNVILVGKSGENDLHGYAFDKYQSPVFRARDYFAQSRGAGIVHSLGFGIGGPVVIPKLYNGKNKTFWYIAGDNYRLNDSLIVLNPTVPLGAWRNGDFSKLGISLKDPFNGGNPFPNAQIPASRINAVSQKIQDRFYPLPNVGDTSILTARNYYQEMIGPPSSTIWHGQARLDQRFTDRDYFYGSFTAHQVQVNNWEGNLPAFGPRLQKRQTKALAMGYTHTFSPSMVNEFRFGYAYGNNPIEGPLNGLEVDNYLGLQGLAPNLPNVSGVFQMAFTGLGLQSLSQVNYSRPGFLNGVYNIHDDISWYHGRHALKAGIQLGFNNNQSYSAGSYLFGYANFSNKYTGQPYADFLLGTPTTTRRNFPSYLVNQSWEYIDGYVQDEWKVTTRLTLSYGVRYQLHLPWHSANGMLATFDPGSASIVVADAGMNKLYPFLPTNYVPIVSASSVGLPSDTIVKADKNNFAPRFSFAYRPLDNNNTVIRGGFGVFYDATPVQLSNSTPFTAQEPDFTNTPVPSVVFPQVFPTNGSGKPTTISLPAGVRSDLQIPYSQRWTFTVEHEHWNTGFSLSYIGSQTHEMVYNRNINQPAVDGQLYINKVRPFPMYPAITYMDNGANHTYNGMTAQVTRATRGGLMLTAAYTWARDLGDDVNPEDSFNLTRERAPDEILPNQRFVATAVYDLPMGKGKKFFDSSSRLVNGALGGWELSVISAQQTGRHLTPSISIPDPTGTYYTTSTSRPTVTIRPDLLGDPTLANAGPNAWFNVNAFGAPALGAFGSSARGVINGPGLNVLHASLFKSFSFTGSERSPKLRVGIVADNLFNHTNFTNPNTSLSAGVNAATISGTGGPNNSNPGDMAGARSMWLHMRLEW
jgi:Carboxypeptidase regulatory-like domain